MSQHDEVTREANRRLVQRRGPDAGVVVRRETTRGCELGDELLRAYQTGRLSTAGRSLTAEGPDGETLDILMFGWSTFGSDDVFG